MLLAPAPFPSASRLCPQVPQLYIPQLHQYCCPSLKFSVWLCRDLRVALAALEASKPPTPI